MKRYTASIRIATYADSPQEAAEVALRKREGKGVSVGVAIASELHNLHNEAVRISFFHAIDDLQMFRKIVKAVALAGVVYNDPELDGLVGSTDDGDEEELLGEYNEGFNKGCDLIGKTYDQVLDDFDSVGAR